MKQAAWIAIIAMVLATATHAATVTYTLAIDPSGANTWQLFAQVNTGDNWGIASVAVSLDNIDAAVTNLLLPKGVFFNTAMTNVKSLGFTVNRVSNTNPIGGSQDTFSPTTTGSDMVFGMGQVGGDWLASPPDPSFPILVAGTEVQPVYGAPLLVAEGTYSGPNVPAFSVPALSAANVFMTENTKATTAATLNFATIPEPATSLLLLAGVGLMSIQRRSKA